MATLSGVHFIYNFFKFRTRRQTFHLTEKIEKTLSHEAYLSSTFIPDNTVNDNFPEEAIELAKKGGVLLGENTFMNGTLCRLHTMNYGRLGNHIFTYVTSLLLALQFNIQPCFSEVSHWSDCNNKLFIDNLTYHCSSEGTAWVKYFRRSSCLFMCMTVPNR